MSLTRNLIGDIEITSGWGVLRDLLVHNPNNISSIRPDSVHGCDLVSGQRGVVGSTICWNYTNDGEKQSSKQIIEAIDESNHKIIFKVVGGDLLKIYDNFTITFQVEPTGVKKLATWTFEFEKPNSSVADPTSLMELMCGIIKDMDVHASDK